MTQPRNAPPAGADADRAAFLRDLRALRDGAGLQTSDLAARAHYPEDTLKTAEDGPALPSLPVLEAYVRGCGARPAEWEDRWRRLTQESELGSALPTRSPTPNRLPTRIGGSGPVGLSAAEQAALGPGLARVAAGLGPTTTAADTGSWFTRPDTAATESAAGPSAAAPSGAGPSAAGPSAAGPSASPGAPAGASPPATESGAAWRTPDRGTAWPSAESGTAWPTAESGTAWPTAESGTAWPTAEHGPARPAAESGMAWPTAERGTTWARAERETVRPATERRTAWPSAESGTAWPAAERGPARPTAAGGAAWPAAEHGPAPSGASAGHGREPRSAAPPDASELPAPSQPGRHRPRRRVMAGTMVLLAALLVVAVLLWLALAS